MGESGFGKEFEEGVAFDVHLVGDFSMDLGDLFVEVGGFFRLFLFWISFNSNGLGPQKGFLFFFPVVFELEPLEFV